MKFLKNIDYMFNLDYVKEFYVNKESGEGIFSIRIIDNDNNIKDININIRDMINQEGVEIAENKKKEIVERVKEECFHIITINDFFIGKEVIDLDDIVNDCLLSVLDMYIK